MAHPANLFSTLFAQPEPGSAAHQALQLLLECAQDLEELNHGLHELVALLQGCGTQPVALNPQGMLALLQPLAERAAAAEHCSATLAGPVWAFGQGANGCVL